MRPALARKTRFDSYLLFDILFLLFVAFCFLLLYDFHIISGAGFQSVFYKTSIAARKCTKEESATRSPVGMVALGLAFLIVFHKSTNSKSTCRSRYIVCVKRLQQIVTTRMIRVFALCSKETNNVPMDA